MTGGNDAGALQCQLMEILGLHAVAAHFLHHHQLFLAMIHYRKRGATAFAVQRIGGLQRHLDVLRIMVAARHDDQFLDAAGHEQFAVPHHAHVAGAHPGLAVVTLDAGAEHAVRETGFVPVTLRHRWTVHPDLTDFAIRASNLAVGIDDAHFRAFGNHTGTHQRGRISRCGRLCRIHFTLRQLLQIRLDHAGAAHGR